jgi:uncharacterized lipoprotein YddW (UPF0748 family)
MAVNALTNRPVPPNAVPHRAMYVWVGGTAALDPLDTDADQQAILNHCGAVGCNTIFLDIWRYLGGSNWTAAKVARMKLFLDAAHRSGIRVFALCGDLGWGQAQAWVMKNIVEAVMAYNALAVKPSEQFDGFQLDVEYWADEVANPPSTHLPGLCDLIKAIKARSNLLVGCFAGFFLKDNSSTRGAITYDGKSAQDGEHLMDVCDYVVVGSYRDAQADIESLFQPWYDYASQQGKNIQLYAGVETTDVAPANITFFGAGKAAMETQLAAVTGTYLVTGNSVFMGFSVHSYDGWKAMGA